jgi:predicted nucleotidyltransferase
MKIAAVEQVVKALNEAQVPFLLVRGLAVIAVSEVAPGVPVRVVRLQTLIDLKRAAGRPRDLADIHELQQLQEDPGHG